MSRVSSKATYALVLVKPLRIRMACHECVPDADHVAKQAKSHKRLDAALMLVKQIDECRGIRELDIAVEPGLQMRKDRRRRWPAEKMLRRAHELLHELCAGHSATVADDAEVDCVIDLIPGYICHRAIVDARLIAGHAHSEARVERSAIRIRLACGHFVRTVALLRATGTGHRRWVVRVLANPDIVAERRKR